ncbi:MAG: long-chain fatty acid--CoA ligase [Chitinophagales bacterium]|nr:long-chain fatty acid--CoA ligase [Chitinophagales bacterium]MCZ2392300.1 long-chain fatty acid--CoA ligase [Chitinophagales bacterium]
MEVKRIFDLLTTQLEICPNNHFLSSKVDGYWKSYTFSQTQTIANQVSQMLLNLGLKKDDKVAIISHNRPEWNFVDLGAQQIGVTVIPMYPTISENDYEYIVNDASIAYAFVGDEVILNKVTPLLTKCASLKGIYSFYHSTTASYFWDALPENVDIDAINSRKATIQEEDLATIIYTSGTTGNPKGVMLTHRNIVSNVMSVKEVAPFSQGEKSLSFLPLCHSFERMGFYAYLCFGIHIHYAESLETIADNLQEVKPYCFTTVPRLLEKVYEKILAKGAALTGVKKLLFDWSMELGSQYKLGENQGLWYNLQLSIARKLVFSKWHDALGGNVHFIVTGAAAMQPRLITLFSAAGVNILEGYGLTETSPVLSVNQVDEKKRCTGTVGLPIPGVEIQLADDNEIIARGPNIMKGYYGRPDLTAEVIDENGWFHTGDIGTWVEKNGYQFLKITDRKKELFKTAGGKYVAPQVIENLMKESVFIEQMMVVGGDDKKFVSALIVPSFLQLEAWAKQEGIQFSSNKDLVKQPEVIRIIQGEVDKYNPQFGNWEQVKKFTLLAEDWTTESGELTPTMKLKRKVIEQKYKKEISELYS